MNLRLLFPWTYNLRLSLQLLWIANDENIKLVFYVMDVIHLFLEMLIYITELRDRNGVLIKYHLTMIQSNEVIEQRTRGQRFKIGCDFVLDA